VSQSEYDQYLQTLDAEGNTGLLGDQYNTNTNQPGTEAPANAAGTEDSEK